MGLKKGTKLTDNPKNVKLTLALTKDESEMISECAEKMNTTRTKVIIEGVKLIKEKLG